MKKDKTIRQKDSKLVWAEFAQRENLSDEQLEQFQKYEAILSDWNETINLTAITGLSEMVNRHFSDSLALRNFMDLSQKKSLVDIGAGAGFPAIPLKIMFPHLGVVLIEVHNKKQKFLRALIEELKLENVEVCDLDWRTFLRTTEGDLDLFVARASIDPLEMARMFKPASVYKNAQLVYWAAEDWMPEEKIAKLVRDEKSYTIKRKERKLVFFGLSE